MEYSLNTSDNLPYKKIMISIVLQIRGRKVEVESEGWNCHLEKRLLYKNDFPV